MMKRGSALRCVRGGGGEDGAASVALRGGHESWVLLPYR